MEQSSGNSAQHHHGHPHQEGAIASSMSQAEMQERRHEMEEQAKFHNLLKDMMFQVAQKRAYLTGFSHVLLSFVTAPLITMNTSMQLSIPRNLVTLDQFKKSTDMIDRKTQVRQAALGQESASNKVSNKLRFSFLNIKNKNEVVNTNRGHSMSLPYRPPVYRTYFECLQGLYKQGIPSFYKGNMTRAIHIMLFHKLSTDLTFNVERTIPVYWMQLKDIPMVKELILSCAVDFMLHPLHLAEGRMILQNRKANFATYSSLLDVFKTSYKEMGRGLLMHFPRNVCIALSGMKLTDQIGFAQYYGQAILCQTLAYPFLTVQRRMECMSQQVGMLSNNEYKGYFNMAKRIYAEEGIFLGLYRGYFAFTMAVMIWMSALPLVTDFLMTRTSGTSSALESIQQLNPAHQVSQQKVQTDHDLNNQQQMQNPYSYDDDEDDDDDEYD